MKTTTTVLALGLTAATALAQVNLANYQRVGRYALPQSTSGNNLAREASGVTWNRDTNTLFVVGDTGRSVTQVSLTGQLIDSMTLALGNSPQGTAFYDTESITWFGDNQFAFVEERTSIISRFTYTANTTLDRGGAQSVTFAPGAGNSGYEGMTYDSVTGGFIVVKEVAPRGIAQMSVDFGAGTSSNGSAAFAPTNLFSPGFAGLTDFSDVFAVGNSAFFTGSAASNLLIISQEDGRVVEVDRLGNVISQLLITADATDTISVADMQHEGITMDDRGWIYIVNENGGGGIDFPELWVFAPVPSPAAAGLLGLAAAAGVARRRR